MALHFLLKLSKFVSPMPELAGRIFSPTEKVSALNHTSADKDLLPLFLWSVIAATVGTNGVLD